MGRIVIRKPKTQAERDEIARLNARASKKTVIIPAIAEIVQPKQPQARKTGAFFIGGRWVARTTDGKEYEATSAEDAQGIVDRGKPFVCPQDKKAAKKRIENNLISEDEFKTELKKAEAFEFDDD